MATRLPRSPSAPSGSALWITSPLRLNTTCNGVPGGTAAPPLFSKTYVFGASVSDTGNACNLIPVACTPNPPYASPRWSNGPVFAELLAQRYGASAAPVRVGGTNYAYGGARTGPVAGTTQSVPNMLTQVVTLAMRALSPSS